MTRISSLRAQTFLAVAVECVVTKVTQKRPNKISYASWDRIEGVAFVRYR